MMPKPTIARRNAFIVFILLPIVGLTISIQLFLFERHLEHQNIRMEFEHIATDRFAAIEMALDTSIQVLESLRAFYAVSEKVERDGFKHFVQPLLANNPAILALKWAPKVVIDERTPFEKAAQESGLLNFKITERAAGGKIIPASASNEYLPLFYIEPANKSTLDIGFDLASDEIFKKELARAEKTGQMVATKPVVLKHGPENKNAVQVIQPVFGNKLNIDASDSHEKQLQGVIVGVFDFGDIIEKALAYLHKDNAHIHLFDPSAEPKERLLYYHQSPLDPQKAEPLPNLDAAKQRHSLYDSATLNVAGRQWKVLCTSTSTFVADHIGWSPWGVLLFGIISTGFFIFYLSNHYVQTQDKEKQVRELQKIIASRDKEITKRKEFQEQLALAANVIKNTIDGISITDSEGNLEQVNPSFTTITGYSAEEVIGQNPRILKSNRHDKQFYEKMWGSLLAKGTWEGQIWNRRKNGETYPEWLSLTAIKDEQGQTKHYVAVFHDITELTHSQETLQYQANYDALTGLPNRMLFNDRLKSAIAHALRYDNRLGVLFLDLDDFKMVNDSHGHFIGDQLLNKVAERLKACCREEDTVSRIYGDEFLLLARTIREKEPAAVRLAERVLKSLKEPIIIDNKELFISASVGITLFPDDGDNVEMLVKNADVAMYRAKGQGKNQICMYTESMNRNVMRQLSLGNDLRGAMERDEFMVFYQPKVDVQSGRIAGMEALARWNCRGKEMVPPNEFIPIAEDSGVIFPLGEWVLLSACSMAKHGAAACGREIHVAVNLSVRQFGQKDLFQIIKKTLHRTDLSPKLLTIEITESIAINDINMTIETLMKLKKMGVRISIDDFGTGYSSLYYLRKMPLSELKIDKSFIDDTPNDADATVIVNTILNLAKNLNLKTVAEGVETIEQLKFLANEGCDEIQGYLFSKPVPATDMEALLIEDKKFGK